VLTEAIENLLNRNLGSSPRARESCAALKGRRLKLVIRDLDLQIGFESVGDSLRISRQTAGEFDAEVEGTPINLLALASPQPERLLKSGTVQVRGDVELLQRYRELALLLRPDLEEELAKLIGDSPAHRLAGLAKAALAFGRRGASTAVQNAAENSRSRTARRGRSVSRRSRSFARRRRPRSSAGRSPAGPLRATRE
jgi:ubiquinone biosynthesis protein UbiJ